MNITSHELDELARAGLDAIAEAVSGTADEDSTKRAELTLKLLRTSQSRMSAETNRLALGYRIARHLGVDKEAIMPLWQAVLPAQAREARQIEAKKGK